MADDDLRELLRRKAAVMGELGQLDAADAKLGLETSRHRGAAKPLATPAGAAATTAAASDSSRPRGRILLDSNQRVFGSLLMGTLRGAQKDIQSQSDADKRRAQVESKVDKSLVEEQASSVDNKRKKLHEEAHELAEKAAELEKQALAPALRAADARLAPFRKTVARPTIYWCKASEIAALRAAELQNRAQELESGEELVVPAVPVPAPEPAPSKRKRSEEERAEGERDTRAARTDPPLVVNQESNADDELDDEPGDSLAVVFD